MKRTIRRIIGFFEFVIGFAGPAYSIYQVLFDDKYKFSWIYLVVIPIYYGLIKYGWRAMFNIIDITEEKDLEPQDIFYQNAVIKAKSEIELFISYLSKGIFECNILIPIKENGKGKSTWVKAEYLDDYSISIFTFPKLSPKFTHESKVKIVTISEVHDWSVKKDDDTLLGLYTIKALAEKALNNGYTLNRKSKQFLNKIIN